jgi:hypothetical protein
VTNLARPAARVVAFYNQRGTAEQWIKEGKGAINSFTSAYAKLAMGGRSESEYLTSSSSRYFFANSVSSVQWSPSFANASINSG